MTQLILSNIIQPYSKSEMTKRRVFPDNCCFNRPYDSQDSMAIRLETEVKLSIQNDIKSGLIELAWSYILDFENTLKKRIIKDKCSYEYLFLSVS